MGIARSTYYGAPPANRDAESLSLIEAICEEFEAYGYRRVTAELRHQGHLANSKKVRPLMREHGLSPNQRRRCAPATDSAHGQPSCPSPAAARAADGPNRLWVAAIAYGLRLRGGGHGWLFPPGWRLRGQPPERCPSPHRRPECRSPLPGGCGG